MKKILFPVVMWSLVFAVIELGARLTLATLFGGQDFRVIAEGRVDEAHGPHAAPGRRYPGEISRQLLHPYLGYVKPVDYRRLFPALVQRKRAGELRVLVLGGSVALGLSDRDQLQRSFQDALTTRGMDVRVWVGFAATPGHKQPQQLMWVNYLLALDAPIDLVINLDGFNEVVLPHYDNARFGVEPSFPRSWAERLAARSGTVDPLVMGRIAYLREREGNALAFLTTHPSARLAVVKLPVALWFNHAERRIAELQDQLVPDPAELSLEQRGTQTPPPTARLRVLRDSARLWARSSLLMADLLAAQGVEYYHFLQPNQYVAGSKPLSPDESAHLFLPDSPYGRNASDGYPLLTEAARELGLERIAYVDATRVFAEEPATVYRDPCCHLNALGNRILAEYLVQRVLERSPRLSGGAPPGPSP